MAEKSSSFQEKFPDVLAQLNAKLNMSSDGRISTFDKKTLNVQILCVVCVMLMHNRAKNSEPTIDTLKSYDLNNFRDLEMLEPYVDYLTQKSKKANKDKLRADYAATMIRYMFILKAKEVYLVTEESS